MYDDDVLLVKIFVLSKTISAEDSLNRNLQFIAGLHQIAYFLIPLNPYHYLLDPLPCCLVFNPFISLLIPSSLNLLPQSESSAFILNRPGPLSITFPLNVKQRMPIFRLLYPLRHIFSVQ